MEVFSAIGLDVIALLIILACAHAAAKKGFLRTVVQMGAYIAVVLAASFISKAAAPMIYDRFVEPKLMDQFESSQEVRMKNASLISMSPDLSGEAKALLEDTLQSIQGLLPEDFDPTEMTEELLEDLKENTLRPLLINAIRLITFVVVFTVLSLLVNMLLMLLGVIDYLPVIGTLNALAGGAVGILQGVLIVWVLGMLVRGLFYLHPEGWWIITVDLVKKSYLFKYFVDPSLLSKFFA